MSIHSNPYGGLISSSGLLAGANTMRFSSKPAILSATGAWGFYYYGYRFYDPGMQRWLNRDPLGEEGGFNIYLMVENNPMNGVDPQGLEKFALEKGAPQLVKLCKANTHCLQGEKVSIWICRRKLKGPEGPYPRIGPLSHSFIVCEDPMQNPHSKQKYGKQPRASSQDGGSFWGPGYVVAEPFTDFSRCREKKVCPADKTRMCKEGPTDSFYFLPSPWHNCHAWANGRCK